MTQPPKSLPEARVREIRRRTRRQYGAEEKIRIVLDCLKGEDSIAELCRREGVNPNLYYLWSKEFLEAGKRRLAGDTKREASSGEVTGLRQESRQLKHLVADCGGTCFASWRGRGSRPTPPTASSGACSVSRTCRWCRSKTPRP